MSALPRFSESPAPDVRTEALAFEGCLQPLLAGLRWRGSPRQLAEATGLRRVEDLAGFRNVMARLGFLGTPRGSSLRDLDARLLPCLFVRARRVLVVLSAEAEGRTLRCYDGGAAAVVELERTDLPGTICEFTLVEGEAPASADRRGWLGRLIHPFRAQFAFLLAVTLALNGLALVPAFFVQAVYDHVLPTRSLSTLAFLLAGAGLAIACDASLRVVRGSALAHIGARLDFLVGTSVLAKMLAMPLGQLERTGLGAKLAQLREGEIVRTLFAGGLATALLELPFVLVFVVALAVMGGWLALVPLATAAAAAAVAYGILRAIRAAARQATRARADHQTLLLEILSHMTTIRAGGTEEIWLERYRDRSAQGAVLGLREARLAGLTETLAQIVNVLAGAVTLTVGAILALDGSLSVGTLIASMTIVWRMLAPLQSIFVALSRIDHVGRVAERLDRLMQAPADPVADGSRTQTARGRRFAGRIAFDRVYFRHDTHHEPALAGVSFTIKPGEIVALTGGNGSGKSTVLKLIAALHQPQMGAVSIDGVDNRQVGAANLRQWISLLPQRADLFPGTLRDNLKLADHGAGDIALWDALAKVGLMSEVEALEHGLDTVVRGQFSASFVRRLVLARTLLVDASIVLLDEPGPMPDDDGQDFLIEQLECLRGRATVIVATHQAEHLRVADRAIVLRSGTVVHDGTPQDLLKRISGTK